MNSKRFVTHKGLYLRPFIFTLSFFFFFAICVTEYAYFGYINADVRAHSGPQKWISFTSHTSSNQLIVPSYTSCWEGFRGLFGFRNKMCDNPSLLDIRVEEQGRLDINSIFYSRSGRDPLSYKWINWAPYGLNLKMR